MPPHLSRPVRGRRGAALLAASALAAGALAVSPIAANRLDVRDLALLSEGNSHTHDPEIVGDAAQYAYARRVTAAAIARSAGARQLAPSDTGAWSPEIPSPVKGIHAILLPTGKILYFGNTDSFAERQGAAQAFLYDPRTGVWTDVRPPNDPYSGKPYNLFCAGHSFLPDGRVVVAGGNQEWPQADRTYIGAKWIFTFNPFTETWTKQDVEMRKGRWYPTLTTLSDGRVVIMSGLDDSGIQDAEPRGVVMNEDVEVFTPSPRMDGADGTIELKPSAQMYTQYYPHLFTLPGDRVLLAGQDSGDTKILDTDTWTWSEVPNLPDERLWSAAVIEPYDGQTGPRYVTVNGGVDSPAPNSDGRTWRLDLQNTGAGWQDVPDMNRGRAHHNMQLLPDGSAVVLGGGKGIGSSAEGRLYAGAVFTAELRRPDGTWLELPAQAQQRTYHSTSVLLPDGRVVSGGDDRNALERPLEIYSPP
jgi:hypothetical protein